MEINKAINIYIYIYIRISRRINDFINMMSSGRGMQDQFYIDFILGKEKQLLALAKSFDAIHGKVLELHPFTDANDILRKVKGVASGVFMASVNGGRILAYLLFAYGIVSMCNDKNWFTISMVIQPVLEAMPTFSVENDHQAGEGRVIKEVARLGYAIRTIWRHAKVEQ